MQVLGATAKGSSSPAQLVGQYVPVIYHIVTEVPSGFVSLCSLKCLLTRCPWQHTGHTCSRGWRRRLPLDSCAALGARQRTWPRVTFAKAAGRDWLCGRCACQLLRWSCFMCGWPKSNAALGEGRSELRALVVCCMNEPQQLVPA